MSYFLLTEKECLRYDREFLLQLRFSAESQRKPVGLPQMPEIIIDMVTSLFMLSCSQICHEKITRYSLCVQRYLGQTLNPVLHELFHDFSVKVHVTGRLIHAVEG